MTDEVLIDGISLLVCSNGGDSLAHWIEQATDSEIANKMREWAAGEISRQRTALREQEANHAAMQQRRKPEPFGVVLEGRVAGDGEMDECSVAGGNLEVESGRG